MNKEDFVEICQICYGDRWVTDTARAIGYTRRHIHNIAAGETPISKGMSLAVISMAMQKRDELSKIIERQDIDFLLKKKKGRSRCELLPETCSE